MKSKQSKPKEPTLIREVLKPELEKIKILKENQPKEDMFFKIDLINNEIAILRSEIVTEFNIYNLQIKLDFNPYTF